MYTFGSPHSPPGCHLQEVEFPWEPNPLKHITPNLAFTTGSHAFGWRFFGQFDRETETPEWTSTWKPPSLEKKYWKILKGPKYCPWNIKDSNLEGWTKNPKDSNIFHYSIWTKITVWILRSSIFGDSYGSGVQVRGSLIFSMVFSDSLTFPQGSPTNPTGFPVTPSPWTASFKKPIGQNNIYKTTCAREISYINIDIWKKVFWKMGVVWWQFPPTKRLIKSNLQGRLVPIPPGLVWGKPKRFVAFPLWIVQWWHFGAQCLLESPPFQGSDTILKNEGSFRMMIHQKPSLENMVVRKPNP